MIPGLHLSKISWLHSLSAKIIGGYNKNLISDPYLWNTQPQHNTRKAIKIPHGRFCVYGHLNPAVNYFCPFIQILGPQNGHSHQEFQALCPVEQEEDEN